MLGLGGIVLFAFLLSVVLLAGCGKKTKQSADAVADEVTGSRPIREGDRLKGQLKKIDEEHEQREKEARGE
jgi:hypothetical protein